MSKDYEYYKRERQQEWRANLRKQLKTKERTKIERISMPEAEPTVRNQNFEEVNKGLTEEQAIIEAQRCIDCPDPTCIEGCPVEINIPKFVKNIERKDFKSAAEALKETNSFPAVCGRVCPQEEQCEQTCFYSQKLNKDPVAIGHLERFVADWERNSATTEHTEIPKSNSGRVGIIGSGPAGLTAAGEIAKKGYKVTVFETWHDIGGVLKYGIPPFRLPNQVIDSEIENLKKLNVRFETDTIVGKTVTIEDLKKEGYKAFFVGSGAGLPKFMNIPGENSVGVYSANEFLTRVNLMNAKSPDYDTPVLKGSNIAVIGGGDTAMDAVRTAKRIGAERAMIVYRRSFEQMPARDEEVKHAEEEGIEFLNLRNPVSYEADENGRVSKMYVKKMELGEEDSSGRRRPKPIPDSEYAIPVDAAVVSIGLSPNPIFIQSMPELDVSERQTIKANQDTLETNIPGIFAGGDIVRGGATVILAMGDARKAASGIEQYLENT